MPYQHPAVSASPTREPYDTHHHTVVCQMVRALHMLPLSPTPGFDDLDLQPNPYPHWIIGVLVASVIVVILIFLRAIRCRQQMVRSRIESGSNGDCKSVIQQTYMQL